MFKGDGIHTEEDVGNLVKSLMEQTPAPLDEVMKEVTPDAVVGFSAELTTGTKDKN